MCPFCVATSMWIAVGAVSAGGVSALTVARLWNSKAQTRQPGASHDHNDQQ